MPRVNFNTKANFDAAYDIGGEPEGHPNTRPEVRLHYHRAVMRPLAFQQADALVAALNLTVDSRIVLVGAGFGWSMERFQQLGILNVVGTDTSPYIQNNKSTTETTELRQEISRTGLDPDAARGATLLARYLDGGTRTALATRILNETLSTNQSRQNVRGALGGNPDWVISEEVISTLTDAEATTLSNNMRGMPGNVSVAHLTTTTRDGQDPAYNWKTLEQWKTLLPNDTFIETGTYRVL